MSLVASIASRMRWLYRSSILRLTLLLSCLFAAGMAAAIVIALNLGREAVLQRVDTALAGLAATIEAEEELAETSAVLIRPLSELGNLPRPFSRVISRGGGTVRLQRDFLRSEVWRVLITQDNEGERILIALPIEDSEDALETLGGVLWTTAAMVILLALLIGLAAGFWAQRRVVRINRTLNNLAAGDLQARTGIDRSFDDLDDLARQLDITAVELERLVAQTRHLSASLAHDLRTPLARLRAQLEMLPEGEERGAALEEAGRLANIFDTIMRVARIEAGHGTKGFEAVNLGDLLDELAETFGPVVEAHDKTLRIDKTGAQSVLADRGMLVQAMANLLQNALVHGGTEISLIAQSRQIGVADNGTGVDPAQYDEIVKPMVRLDAARESDGTGLGLALVRAVADRHGARLELSSSQPSGLQVFLKFTDL